MQPGLTLPVQQCDCSPHWFHSIPLNSVIHFPPNNGVHVADLKDMQFLEFSPELHVKFHPEYSSNKASHTDLFFPQCML